MRLDVKMIYKIGQFTFKVVRKSFWDRLIDNLFEIRRKEK